MKLNNYDRRQFLKCIGTAVMGSSTAAFRANASADPEVHIQLHAVTPTARHAPSIGAGYSVSTHAVGASTERRMHLHGHHFATLVDDGNGTFAFRPRPGVDRNGFGSSLVLQPFFAGATIRHATVDRFVATMTGIEVDVSGLVSLGASNSFGSWSLTGLKFTYVPANKVIEASGVYQIDLAGLIASAASGDLSLYKLASNFLHQVPRIDQAVHNTGDMIRANYITNSGPAIWSPIDGNHFPGPATDFLSIDAVGDFYDVDNPMVDPSYCPIQRAAKPSLRVDLTAQESGYDMIPGFAFDSDNSQAFFLDNVGITPVIRVNETRTSFLYNVLIRSEAIADDGLGFDLAMGASVTGTSPAQLDIFHAPSITAPRNNLVGHLHPVGGGVFHGDFALPLKSTETFHHGVFQARTPC